MRGFTRIFDGFQAHAGLPSTITAAALTASALVIPAQAQAQTQVWSLPEPTSSATTSTVQGPVDQGAPVAGPTTTAAPTNGTSTTSAPTTSAPTTSAPATKTPTTSAPATRTPTTKPAAPAARHEAPKSAPPSAAPRAGSAAKSTSSSKPTATLAETPTPAPTASATPARAPSPALATPEPARPQAPAPLATGTQGANASLSLTEPARWPLWWWLVPAALIALAAFALLQRKRANTAGRSEAPAPDDAVAPRPAAPRPEPTSAAAPTPIAPPAPAPSPTPVATPDLPLPAEAPDPLRAEAHGELGFEPLSLRLSLVYATLRFRFAITALSEIPPSALHGDMISAHGSASPDEQLLPPLAALPRIGAIPHLRIGQRVILEGELKLPLADVKAVREGDATFLVPLVRLAVITDEAHEDYADDLPHLELGLVFTVGQRTQRAALAPMRTDTGPRDFTDLDVREVEGGRRKSLLPLAFTPSPV